MIEKVSEKNLEDYKKLVRLLWQDVTDEHFKELTSSKKISFMKKVGEEYVGFIDCSIRREYVEGCKTKNVGYLEGIYVLPDFRRRGYADELVKSFEKWAKSKNCKEVASDTQIVNYDSIKFHIKLGYEAKATVVHFAKEL